MLRTPFPVKSFLCRFLVFAASIVLFSFSAHAAERSLRGVPAIKIHSSDEIGSPHGSRFVSLDSNGRILFSSEGELSAYDGTEWRQISSPGNRTQEDFVAVRSHPDGTLYAGGLGFWGKLTTDFKGRYTLDYLSTEAEQSKASVEYFTDINFAGENVFFAGLERLVRWNPQTGSTVFEIPNIEFTFVHGETLFIQCQGDGLYRLINDKIEFVAGSEILVDGPSRTRASTQWSDSQTALYNTERGIILFDGESFFNFPDNLAASIPNDRINDMQRIDENLFVVSAAKSGLVFFDRNGDVQMKADKSIDPRLFECGRIVVGPDKSVWVSLSDGVAQVLYPSNVTFVDHHFGIPLNYFSTHFWNGELYLRSSGKLFQAQHDPENGLLSAFTEFPNLPPGPVLATLPTESGLIVAVTDAIYRIDHNSRIQTLATGVFAFRILKSDIHPNRFVVTGPELASIFEENEFGSWDLIQNLNIGGRANKLLEDGEGNIWVERGISKIGRLQPQGDQYRYVEYGVDDGLTSDQWIALWAWDDGVCFTSRKGVLRYSDSEQRFIIADDVNSIIPDRIRKLTRPAQAPNGDFWIAALDGNVVMRKQADGSYLEDNITLEQLSGFRIYDSFFGEDGTVWLASKQSLARIENASAPQSEIPAPKIVQITNQKNGKLLGHFQNSDSFDLSQLTAFQNNLRFQINTPYYRSIGGLRHRFWLTNHTSDWTEPRSTSEITFSKLPPGSYELLVQAVSKNGQLSPITRLPINIAPPIYLTPFAYVLYVVALCFLVFLFLRFRERKHIAQQRELERKVLAQTRELREKNLQIHQAYLSERELKKRAETANRSKSDFLAMVSHEIRTPMNCVLGITELLLDSPVNLEQHEMLKTIRASGRSLISIISDILDFSKIQSGKIEFETIPYSPKDICQNVYRLFIQSARDKNLSLKLRLADGLPSTLIGDPTRITQILINLVGNAIKFTHSGTVTIEISNKQTSDSEHTLYFSVRDTGIGIESDKMDKLFRSFSQVDSSNTRRFGGTGLGLAICRKLVNLMGGEISVSSVSGQGSTFSFHIPAREATAEEIARFEKESESDGILEEPPAVYGAFSTQDSPEISDQRRDILLVEDNPINQQVTAMMLRRIGYTFDVANNGKQACKAAAKKRYRLILMDIQMPEMDGIECTKRIVANAQGEVPPILAVTAKATEFDKEIAYAAGMSGYLTKPLERAKLKESIDSLINAEKTIA